jgi:hypothetical protein
MQKSCEKISGMTMAVNWTSGYLPFASKLRLGGDVGSPSVQLKETKETLPGFSHWEGVLHCHPLA